MVEGRRVGYRIARVAIRAIEAGFAVLLILSVWLLGEVPTGPGTPEQAGTFAVGFLFAWAFATIGLTAALGVHGLGKAYRHVKRGTWPPIDRPSNRVLVEGAIGIGLVFLLPGATPGDDAFGAVIAATTVLAWVVLLHLGVGVVLFCRTMLDGRGG